jgi:hypothetical protein
MGKAEHLMFFRIDFDKNTATVAYNGPERLVRRLLPKTWSGTLVVPLADILKLARKVRISEQLPLLSTRRDYQRTSICVHKPRKNRSGGPS